MTRSITLSRTKVATIPTANGLEDAVQRLLASAKPIQLDVLGLSHNNLRDVKTASQRPYGMLLCGVLDISAAFVQSWLPTGRCPTAVLK